MRRDAQPLLHHAGLYNAFKGKLATATPSAARTPGVPRRFSRSELMTSLRTEYDSFAAKCEGFSLREKLFGAK
ncbi:MAG: hypothetical protein ACLRMJ_08385 [Alistipes finegoldii]